MRKLKLLLSAICFICCFSCNEQSLVEDPNEIALSDSLIVDDDFCDIVTDEDICNIALKFQCSEKSGIKTRKINDYSVSTLYDGKGMPAIYVINYDGNNGFILVSATKRYMPVVGYSDKGNFDIYGYLPDGLKEWKDGIISNIRKAKDMPVDSVSEFKSLWSSYESKNINEAYKSPFNQILTASSIEEDRKAAVAEVMDSVQIWLSKGYKVTRFIPGSEEYDEEAKNAKEGVYPLYWDDWTFFAVKLERSMEEIITEPDFMKSTWAQDNGYNLSCPKINGIFTLVGCLPVAAGQIMRYYQKPSTLNWGAMPLDYPSKETTNFLYELANKSKANFGITGTSVNLKDMKSALLTYGYLSDIKDHNTLDLWKAIHKKVPVLMGADFVGSNSGHAWVASGGREHNCWIQNDLFLYTDRTKFQSTVMKMRNYHSFYYFYMNWGWGGSYNGFYMDSWVKIPGYEQDLENRKDIYVIPFK